MHGRVLEKSGAENVEMRRQGLEYMLSAASGVLNGGYIGSHVTTFVTELGPFSYTFLLLLQEPLVLGIPCFNILSFLYRDSDPVHDNVVGFCSSALYLYLSSDHDYDFVHNVGRPYLLVYY